MTRQGWIAAAAAAGASLLLAASALANGVSGGDPPPAAAGTGDPVPGLLKSPAEVERGRGLFMGTCAAYCHRMTPGPGDAPFLFDCDWLHGGGDQQIFYTITHGAPGTRMVAFGGAIADADIWRIVAYLKSASLCKP